ncbi:hypothetical protein VTO42DRAFT_7986 [Malbranchea cinnamomea]
MTVTSLPHRPWEDSSRAPQVSPQSRAQSQTQSPVANANANPSASASVSASASTGSTTTSSSNSQTLPPISALTSTMAIGSIVSAENPPAHASVPPAERDSGNWSMPQSARSSTYSSISNIPHASSSFMTSAQPSPARLSTVSDMNYSADHYPPLTPTSNAPQQPPGSNANNNKNGSNSSNGNGNGNGSLGSSQPHGQMLPSISHSFDASSQRPLELPESRRSSLDSRMNQGISNLALNPSSPYHSHNASQTSIVSNMHHRDRGLSGDYVTQVNGQRGPRFHPGSPLGPREHRPFPPGRTAPAISSNPRSEIYNAEAPTAGLAYAFPDPGVSAANNSRNNDLVRRGSKAEPTTSSMYTTDSRLVSRLPQGQQELPQAVHHHTLQHRQVRNLIGEAEASGPTPYSRTPELRITHKLAERKRRSEMKDLFELLRSRLPPNENSKTSKWETLNRAIEYIGQLEKSVAQFRQEACDLRQELDELRMQISHRQHQQPPQGQQLPPANYDQRLLSFQSNANPQPSFSQSLFHPPFTQTASAHSSTSHNQSHDPSRTLPPLINGSCTPMQGIQYTDDKR